MNEDLATDILWHLEDIKEMLMSRGVGGERIYGCDEWSVPVKNIDTMIGKLEAEIKDKKKPAEKRSILSAHKKGTISRSKVKKAVKSVSAKRLSNDQR